MRKVKKAKWLVVLMVVAMLFAMVPAAGGATDPDSPAYAFVPNSGEASVSKILLNPETGDPSEVARYSTLENLRDEYTADEIQLHRPNRIAIDSGGNAWVLNTMSGQVVGWDTAQGSVVRISGSPVEGEITEEANNNTSIEGDFDGIVEDDVRVSYFEVGAEGEAPRTISIVEENGDIYLWIGFYVGGYFQKYWYDAENDELVEVTEANGYDEDAYIFVGDYTPYYTVLDGGYMWVSSRNSGYPTSGVDGVLLVDLENLDWKTVDYSIDGNDIPYSIVVASDGKVWVSDSGGGWPGTNRNRTFVVYTRDGFNITGSEPISVGTGYGSMCGFTEFPDGVIWATEYFGKILKGELENGDWVFNEERDLGPLKSGDAWITGITADPFGYLWVISHNYNSLFRFHPDNPGDWVEVPVGLGPYAYADFVADIPDEPEYYGFCGYKYLGDTYEGLEGWTINLEVWVDGDWETYKDEDGNAVTATTDEDGKYCFTDLPAGTYRVSECMEDWPGWAQVYPEDNEHIVVLPLDAHVIYGVERVTGDLYEIDILSGMETKIAATGDLAPENENSPNGLAYDIVNKRLYFGVSQSGDAETSDLYFYDVANDEVDFAGEVEGVTAGAAFGKGAYWYIKNATDDLYKVTFDDDGLMVANPLVKANVTGENLFFRFGDLAVSPDGNYLYGSSLSSLGAHEAFFSIDLTDPDYAYTEIKYPALPAGLQLAYGSDGELYGHSTGSQDWYHVDTATGDFTLLDVSDDLTRAYTDLAQGQSLFNFVNEPKMVKVCETAWGYNEETSSPNNEVEGNPSEAWGWTNKLTVADAVYTLDLYVGAAQNDLDKGTWVGTVKVVIDGGMLTATYELGDDFEDCWFSEVHLWVGETELPMPPRGRDQTPTPTAAPGQFNNIAYPDDTEHTFTVDVSEFDEVWVAAHAVVCCWEYDPDYNNND